MVSLKLIEKQLKKIDYNYHGWGRTEVRELPNVLLDDEEIYECVNGLYEGGFALMVATDIRVLLIDKKPLNYLSVEDMRYELISEIDYNHRLLGAYISLSSGSKNLKFSSLNQHRLRKLITHVQHCMAEGKKKQSSHQADQNQHLEQINQQLQSYLVAQYKQQQKLHEQLQKVWEKQPDAAMPDLPAKTELVQPNPQLADYLFAQSLLQQHESQTGEAVARPMLTTDSEHAAATITAAAGPVLVAAPQPQAADLYAEGRKEIFAQATQAAQPQPRPHTSSLPTAHLMHLSGQALASVVAGVQTHNPFVEVNPLGVAYSKLPMALRNRKFGRPLFHAHSQEAIPTPAPFK
jgi:hypothetical protein